MGNAVSGISIVVPVGPQKTYDPFIPECLESITSQMSSPDEIILVGDGRTMDDLAHWGSMVVPHQCQLVRNHWLVGCGASWNFGVAVARNELVLLMGSDDKLLPDALTSLREAWTIHNYKDAWYNLTIRIDEGPDTGVHTVFNNAAAVTKGLWKLTGGFPISAGVGAPDALLISIMMVHMSDRLIQVREGHPLYWCRVHPDQDTPRQAGLFWSEVISIRDKETARWQKPEWTEKL